MKRIHILLLAAAIIAVSCQTEEKQRLEQLQQELSGLEQQPAPSVPPEVDATVPDATAFTFSFDKQRYGVDAGGSATIEYTLSEAADIDVVVKDGWNAIVDGSGKAEGSITVAAPDPAVASEIVVTATTADGRQTASILPVMIRDPYTDATRTDIAAMAYYCFPQRLVDMDYHFEMLKKCGMNMLSVEWVDNWQEQLDLAQKYGLKVVLFVNEPGGKYYEDRSSTLLEETIAVAKNHPALAAYQIFDEPHLMYLDQLRTVKRIIEELDPNPEHPVYLNIGPSNASEATYGTRLFEDYVEILISECDLKFISFDQYPVYIGMIDPTWIRTLDIIYKACKRHDIPFWAFTLCCREWYREDPTLENIRLQCNTNLAYGAQVNQFFVYRNTSGTSYAPLVATWDNSVGIFKGEYTTAYDDCRTYCTEMHNRGYVFSGSNVTKIRQCGVPDLYNMSISTNDLPPQIKSIDTGRDALISFVENKGNKYMVVVNSLWESSQEVQIELNDMVYMIDHDGRFTELQPGRSGFTVEGGDMLVFKYE